MARRFSNHINPKRALNQENSNLNSKNLCHQQENNEKNENDHQNLPKGCREVSVDVEFPQHIIDIEKGYHSDSKKFGIKSPHQKQLQDDEENGCFTNKLVEQTPIKVPQHFEKLPNDQRSLTNAKQENFQPKSLCVRAASVSVGLVFLTTCVTLFWYYFGWMLGLPALILAIIAILLTTVGWRWFYIAAVTSKRDIT